MYFTDNPVADAENYYAELDEIAQKHEIGTCEECGQPIYDDDYAEYEEDKGYRIDGVRLHERCIIDYAKKNCRLD